MKKTLIIFISIMMSFTLFGCANQTDTIGQQNQDTGTTSQTEDITDDSYSSQSDNVKHHNSHSHTSHRNLTLSSLNKSVNALTKRIDNTSPKKNQS